jgi:hypothetical protein
MEPTSVDQLTVLRGHSWSSGLHYYDFLQSIRFGRDGWGILTQGDGQAIKIQAKFRYSLPSPSRLSLEFFDTPAFYDPEEIGFARTEENAFREPEFELIAGPHEADCQTMGGMVKRSFPWLLRFHCEPFPIGDEPNETRLEYYGRPLRANEQA